MPRIYSVSSWGRFNSYSVTRPRPPGRPPGARTSGRSPWGRFIGGGHGPRSVAVAPSEFRFCLRDALRGRRRRAPRRTRVASTSRVSPRRVQAAAGATFDLNPELWTVPLAGRPAAVRGPSRSSRLEQKARGRFSAGGLQWRPRARHLRGSRALLTIASYRMRPRAPHRSTDGWRDLNTTELPFESL